MSDSNGSGSVLEIRTIRAGQKLFESNGYSFVKVTRDGVSGALKLPIRSTGLTEVLQKFRKLEPTPPSTAQLVLADSDVGRKLAMAPGTKQFVYMPDLTDEKYKEKLAEFNRLQTLEIIHQALAVDFYDESGSRVEDRDAKIAMLEEQGISAAQFNQIVADINALTTLSEADREAFFAESSASARKPVRSPASTESPRSTSPA